MGKIVSKRRFLSKIAFAGATIAASPALPLPFSRAIPPLPFANRPIHAQETGVTPGSPDDQSAALQRLLDLSHERDIPVFLPGGVYKAGGLILPRRTRLVGVPGSTRLTFNGRSFLARAERADLIHIHGIIFDGLGLPPEETGHDGQGLLSVNTVRDLRLDACDFIGAGAHGLDLTGAGGAVRTCHFSAIRDTAILCRQSSGMTITDNHIADCGNGGIIVHRFTPGNDGSIVSRNRIETVRAANGGTGQWGNGIGIYQAHNVQIADNHIADCAFSAVRANGAHNVSITGNNCTSSGETALYAEFAFQGALIANNIVDGGTIGISLANFNEGGRLATVNGNIVRNLTNRLPYENPGPFKPGIGIYAEADTTITGNVVENAPQTGIHIGWGAFCRNVIVSRNIVRSVPWGVTASVVPGAGSVIVDGNIFDDIAEQAITGFEWMKPATKDLLGARATGYGHLAVSGNRLSEPR